MKFCRRKFCRLLFGNKELKQRVPILCILYDVFFYSSYVRVKLSVPDIMYSSVESLRPVGRLGWSVPLHCSDSWAIGYETFFRAQLSRA